MVHFLKTVMAALILCSSQTTLVNYANYSIIIYPIVSKSHLKVIRAVINVMQNLDQMFWLSKVTQSQWLEALCMVEANTAPELKLGSGRKNCNVSCWLSLDVGFLFHFHYDILSQRDKREFNQTL